MKRDVQRWIVFPLFLFIFAAVCQGCSVKLVADYDSATAETILQTAKSVDAFYIKLLDTPENDRTYEMFMDSYNSIEIELGGLLLRNQIRPLNTESVKITETALNFWVKYKEAHKEQGAYKDALAGNHRKRFARLFVAMSIAEEAKKAAAEPDNE